MRVLHLISSAGWYGAENVLVNLAAASRQLGCDARAGVLCDRRNPHLEVAERAAERQVPAEVFHCRGRLDFGTVSTLRRYLHQNGIDILHTHGYKAHFYAVCALRGASRPGLVTTCHTGTDQPEKTAFLQLYDALTRMLRHRAGRIVAVSPAIAGTLRAEGVPLERLATIPNGIDVGRFDLPHQSWPDVPSGAPVVGIVGRLIREKGPYCLLEAARRVLAQVPEARFVFVGDGPERGMLQQAAERDGLAPHILFAGVRTDMPAVYAALDVFVQPSFSEGMPLTVLEAMAAGLPIVATSVGAVPELLDSGSCGLLCPPEDAGALADALMRILRNPDDARRLGANARTRLHQHYSAEAMARRYLDVYQALLDEKAVRP